MAAVFGEEVMNRDEKLRRLPGFPMEKCAFGKRQKCMNPDCNAAHPCDTSNVNPLINPVRASEIDLYCCQLLEENDENQNDPRKNKKQPPPLETQKNCNKKTCKYYSQKF